MAAELTARVQTAIQDPRLARNIRGQVAVALRYLGERDRKRLACDFAEHVLRFVCADEPLHMQVYQRCIDTIRAFLAGHATIQEVDEIYFYEESCPEPTGSQGDRVAYHAFGFHVFGSVLYLLYRSCCQRELEAAGLVIRTKYEPDAISVAQEACYAVARRAGGPDWSADDPAKREVARARGQHASEDEARWQLKRILEYVQTGQQA